MVLSQCLCAFDLPISENILGLRPSYRRGVASTLSLNQAMQKGIAFPPITRQSRTMIL